MNQQRIRARRAVLFLFSLLLLLSACGTPAPAAPRPSDASSEQFDLAPTNAPSTSDPSALPAVSGTPAASDPGTLSVLFINVGRADAALVQYGGKTVLIDTGTEESQPQLLAALAVMGVAQIDALVLTHTHSDHIGGMRGVGRYFSVAAAYRAEISEMKKKGGNKIDERAAELDIPLTLLSTGDTIPLADGAAFEVLCPLIENTTDDNDNSLVLRLACNGRTLLFTGDMQFSEEQTLLESAIPLRADVLKVGNHGNPDATSDVFAAAVSPTLAFIPTDTREDANSANPRVLAALGNADIYITQDFAVGALLTVAPDGTMNVADVPRPAKADAAFAVTSFDRENQTVTVQNTGGAAGDLSYCILFSARGGEIFRFPAGAMLAGGASAAVGPAGGAGDYHFAGEDSIWHKTKDDTAILYDPFGNELSRFAG